jgi:hypothetical protein
VTGPWFQEQTVEALTGAIERLGREGLPILRFYVADRLSSRARGSRSGFKPISKDCTI